MVVNYKCPQCGSDMSFDYAGGMLKCGSCGFEMSAEQYQHDYIKTDDDTAENEFKQYKCVNCGAEIITDNNTTSIKCSFCGSNITISERLSGKFAPKYVIPFTIGKQEAQQGFKKWCKNGRFCPSDFATADRIADIVGMYVPFWLYDINLTVNASGRAEKIRHHSDSRYNYRETSVFRFERTADIEYDKIPADASEKLNDELMDKLEPFDYSKMVSFKMPYLAGYVSEKYDFGSEQLSERVLKRAAEYSREYIKGTLNGYSAVHFEAFDADTVSIKPYYALFPIWLIYYDYNDNEHIFAMNGQTGKIVGKPPLDKGKIALWYIVLSIIFGIIASIVVMLIMRGGL